MEMKREITTAKVFLLWLLLAVGLITTGSLTGGDALTARRCKDGLSWHRLKYLKHINSHRSGADIIGNVIIYIPLGVLAALTVGAAKTPWAWLLVGFGPLMSFSIEYLQQYVGRCTDCIDLVMNSGGYLLGFFAMLIWQLWRKRHP